MKKIADTTIYQHAFSGDRYFDETSDKLGQNLRIASITLKERAEQRGYTMHTIDMYKKLRDVDFFIR